MLKLKNLSKTFWHRQKPIKVLDALNLQITTGQIVGLVGDTGSGKTTLLKILNGLLTPDPHPQTIFHTPFNRFNSATIFQNFNLVSNLTVFDNVAVALKIRSHPHQSLPTAVHEVLAFVGLTPFLNAYPATLSGGQQQRVAIARALVTQPQIIFCDEPTSALNQAASCQILKLFHHINQTLQTTIVIVTHDVRVVTTLCSQVTILRAGKIVTTQTLQPTYDFTPISYETALGVEHLITN